jgi:hypothetical protein
MVMEWVEGRLLRNILTEAGETDLRVRFGWPWLCATPSTIFTPAE